MPICWGGRLHTAENEEQRTTVSALAVDFSDMSCFEVAAYDLTETGCWISSDKVYLLKDEFGLRLSGTDKLVRGTIVAFSDTAAQVSFLAQSVKEDERRREPRRPVLITAILSSPINPRTMKCKIVDASKSGCRLESDKLADFPDQVELSIPGLDLPIAGKIVWRANEQAGVRLAWPVEPRPDEKPEAKSKLDEVVRIKPKKRISAFGV